MIHLDQPPTSSVLSSSRAPPNGGTQETIFSLIAKNKVDSAFYVKDNLPAPGQYEAPTFLVWHSSNLENIAAQSKKQRVCCQRGEAKECAEILLKRIP